MPQVLPPTSTMLAAAAAARMHPLMHSNPQDQLSNNTPHLHHSKIPSSIYVDINSISAASISTPSTSLTNTAVGIRSGDSLTPNPQQHLLSSNPATPLMQHALHNNNGNIQNVVTSASIQHSPLQQHEQQLAAAATAAAVAAATAAAAHQQQHQQQLQQLHQIQQQQHHQLMLMQQQHQNNLQMEHHHALNNPFHHHVLQSAQLVADSIGAFAPQ